MFWSDKHQRSDTSPLYCCWSLSFFCQLQFHRQATATSDGQRRDNKKKKVLRWVWNIHSFPPENLQISVVQGVSMGSQGELMQNKYIANHAHNFQHARGEFCLYHFPKNAKNSLGPRSSKKIPALIFTLSKREDPTNSLLIKIFWVDESREEMSSFHYQPRQYW